MSLIGIDLNSSRARALAGATGLPPCLVALEEDELPLAINLETRRPQIGRAGLAVCRRLPHLVCLNYLSRLGEPGRWQFGRHRLDANKATTLLLNHLKTALPKADAVALALPDYLNAAQVKQLGDLAKKARFKIAGTVTAALAAAWAAQTVRPWDGLALVVDADDHALTWSAVAVGDTASGRQAQVVGRQSVFTCGLRAWRERLLDGLADHCIRQTRRDLRSSANAEQRLFNQLDGVMNAAMQGKIVSLSVEAEHWCQELVLSSDDTARCCVPLLRSALVPLRLLSREAATDQPPELLLVTPAAARLPGLLAGIRASTGVATRLALLDIDALAMAAWEMAALWHNGYWAANHLAEVVPLRPRPRPTPRPPGATTFPRPYVSRPKTPPPFAEEVVPPDQARASRIDLDDDFSLAIED
jgi:hypothetical protein